MSMEMIGSYHGNKITITTEAEADDERTKHQDHEEHKKTKYSCARMA